jgi:hypothetical protein
MAGPALFLALRDKKSYTLLLCAQPNPLSLLAINSQELSNRNKSPIDLSCWKNIPGISVLSGEEALPWQFFLPIERKCRK